MEGEAQLRTYSVDEEAFGDGRIVINIGPSHPAMHGIIRIIAKIEGERIIDSDIELGYLHRGFEKTCENVTYNQVVPYTDRLNYVSPLLNNVGYALAVEKLIGIDVPERCKYLRVIASELSRLTDHLTCIAANAMELGAFTIYFYLIKPREEIYQLIDDLCGGRVTTNYTRIGGVTRDLPENFEQKIKKIFDNMRICLDDSQKLLTRNRIFTDRMTGTGKVSREDAIAFSFTGPVLRSTGVAYDVRKAQPYLIYDKLDFDIPVGSKGDNYDRYLVRMEEMYQSMRIVEQAVKRIPAGPIRVDNPGVSLPPKEEVYGTIEGLMSHFKLIFEGVKPPEGEVYFPIEAANGELGFYIVSDGTGRPYRLRLRPPCFALMQGVSEMIKNGYIADIIATFGQINMIAGECER
jgi:NADH-quinone oxidoreductase subunit D